MQSYRFYSGWAIGGGPTATIPAETLEEAYEEACRRFPRGGRLYFGGVLVKNVPIRLTDWPKESRIVDRLEDK